jgi:hypothetical protein
VEEKQMKLLTLAEAMLLLLLVPGTLAFVDPCESGSASISVGSGQYVKITVDPCDKDIYYYSWDTESAAGTIPFTYVNPAPSDTTPGCAIEFNAPIVLADEDPATDDCADYYISVEVTNKERGSCTDKKCITVHVCPTPCPLTDELYCESDYGVIAGTPKVYTYAGAIDSTLKTKWLVGGADHTADATGAYEETLTVQKSWLTAPSVANPKTCTDVQFTLTDSKGNVLVDCGKQICLVFRPVASIVLKTTP